MRGLFTYTLALELTSSHNLGLKQDNKVKWQKITRLGLPSKAHGSFLTAGNH